jgi:hypothetical protein
MHSQIEAPIFDDQDRVDVPLWMQRPMGIVFVGMAFSCVFVLALTLAIVFARWRLGQSIAISLFAAATPVLAIASYIFGRIGVRLMRRRENQVGRGSGRSLPSRPLFTYPFFIMVGGMVLAERLLTGAMLWVTLVMISSCYSSLAVAVVREKPMHNQSPDPTLPRTRLLRGRRRAPR